MMLSAKQKDPICSFNVGETTLTNKKHGKIGFLKVKVGMTVKGNGIPKNTTVLSVNGNGSIEISAATTETGADVKVKFLKKKQKGKKGNALTRTIRKRAELVLKFEGYEWIFPKDDKLLTTDIVLKVRPSKESMWHGAEYTFKVKIPAEFPNVWYPPKSNLHLVEKIWHPNIDETGAVCLGKDFNWTATMGFNEIRNAIWNLFCYPNPEDPLAGDAAIAAEQMRLNKETFHQQVKKSVRGESIKINNTTKVFTSVLVSNGETKHH